MLDFVIPQHSGRAVLQDASLNEGLANELLEELSDHDALYITEDGSYERCEELARHFLKLHPRQRTQFVDLLAATLHTLCDSARNLLSTDEDIHPGAVLQHKNGLNMCLYLLHTVAMQAQKDAQHGKGAENAVKTKTTGRSRKAAAALEDDGGWDWQHSRERVLLAARELMLVDLKALFKGLAATERLINLCMELALQGLESKTVVKQDSWPACQDVLVQGAVRYQQLDFVAAALMERARQHEHLPQLVALLAKFAEEKHNSTQLGVKLLSEFCRTAPEEYDVQYGTNPVSVRLAGDMLTCLAELLPKVVSNHMSQLQPYLGCAKAYCLRGALLEATGSVLVKVFPTGALSASLAEGAAAAHLRSKEALLALLHARVLDKVAFVRQKVMQTWAKLVEARCVPLSHWNSLMSQAIGRLEDDSQLVVKAAVQLLHTMVSEGIFQPPLKPHVYINTLRRAEAELAQMLPQQGAEEDEQADGGARWEEGAIQIQEERVEQPEEEDEQQPAASATPVTSDAAIQSQRFFVANLKEGVSFCKRLSAALQQVQVLLANPAASVVHDAIVFLTLCKTFEVSGAAKALRGMWPLVFSKHEPVKEAVLDSWSILHLHNKGVKEQLEELLKNVIPGSSLSELTALESIIASLVQQQKLSAATLTRNLMSKICQVYSDKLEKLPVATLQQAAQLLQQTPQEQQQKQQQQHQDAEPADAMDTDTATPAAAPAQPAQEVTEAAVAMQHLRNAFTLLAMLTAAQPSVLEPNYVAVLSEIGLSSQLGDAWLARHTCLTFRSAAAHLTPSSRIQAAVGSATSGPSAAATAAVGTSNNSTGTSNDQLPADMLHDVLADLVRLLVAAPPASMAFNWPSAAEAAVGALYALSPQPQELMVAVLKAMFVRCKPGNGSDPPAHSCGYSAAALSRFFFVLGRAALHHLLCIEQIAKAIRSARLAADRAASEAAERQRETAAAGRRGDAKGQQQQRLDDIGALLGVGSVAADAELDALAEMLEAKMLAKDQLLGVYGQLLSRFCHKSALLSAPQELQASSLLALTQLMAVDGQFCNDNVALLFTLLVEKKVCADIRVNMVVSLADLTSRFPNVLEIWTSSIYKSLEDPEPAVKLAALSSLTHLVLGGMVKAKGNVAKVAALLVDDDSEIIDRVVLFFESLAKTGSGSARSGSGAAGASAANPVYNLLPDCLSALLIDKRLREEQLQVIMGQLLSFVKDKQADSLRERLVGRLAAGGPREWRTVAWCIGQLGYSEKGLRRVVELTPAYRHTLGEQQVFIVFMALADKVRRSTGNKAAVAAADAELGSQSLAGGQGDVRMVVEEWVADLTASREAAIEAAEVEAAEAARQQQQEQAAQPQQQDEDEEADQPPESVGPASEGQDMQADTAAAGASTDTSYADATAAAELAAADAGRKSDVAGGSSSDDSDDQIALMQSQDVADLDNIGEALEAAGAAAGVNRLSLGSSKAAAAVPRLATAAGRRRSQQASAVAPAAGTGTMARSQRRSSTAATAAKQAVGAAARAAGRTRSKPAAKAHRGCSSDGDDSSSSYDGLSDVSSSSEDDDAGSHDQQPTAADGRRAGRAAASDKQATGRASSDRQQQERFVDFGDSEDDD